METLVAVDCNRDAIRAAGRSRAEVDAAVVVVAASRKCVRNMAAARSFFGRLKPKTRLGITPVLRERKMLASVHLNHAVQAMRERLSWRNCWKVGRRGVAEVAHTAPRLTGDRRRAESCSWRVSPSCNCSTSSPRRRWRTPTCENSDNQRTLGSRPRPRSEGSSEGCVPVSWTVSDRLHSLVRLATRASLRIAWEAGKWR